MDFKNEYAKDYMLCVKCCSIIDNIYEFNNNSLRNIDIMTHYMSQLSSKSNQRCKLVVELSDWCNPNTFNEECINLEDAITSKGTAAMAHNTERKCETMPDNTDIILHQSDDACISTLKIVNNVSVENNEINVNKVVKEACVDDINIIKKPDIKIQEPEVVADCLKHGDEKSDINNAHTFNRDCINLEGGNIGVTDVMVHDQVPVSDSLHANDDVVLHQQEDAYGELVNYVKVEYNDGNVEEECRKTEEYAHGTPSCVGDPIIIEEDASPHEPFRSEGDFSISNLANNACNTSSVHTFRAHLLTGTDKGAYACDLCDRKCSTKDGLIRHRRIHTDEKPYVCDICNKAFTQSANLVTHKRVHTGEKPYACDVCNKRFSRNDHFIKHKRMHTGEKPFACDLCKKVFSWKSGLVNHKRMHTGEKPYKCHICYKGFSQSSSLVTHKRRHTGEKPHACDLCDKCFIQNSDLVKHKRLHTGEKPYVCEVCNKVFRDKCNFVKHKRIHTGEKRYVCKVCNKSFTQNSHLEKHKLNHKK